jgi:hypothetical protein
MNILLHDKFCFYKTAACFGQISSSSDFIKVYNSIPWEDNIKMDDQEVVGGRGDWRELAQDRDGWWALVSTVKNLRVP